MAWRPKQMRPSSKLKNTALGNVTWPPSSPTRWGCPPRTTPTADFELGRTLLDEQTALEQERAGFMGSNGHIGSQPHGGAEQVLRQELHAADILAVETGRSLALAQGCGEFLDRRRAVASVRRLH